MPPQLLNWRDELEDAPLIPSLHQYPTVESTYRLLVALADLEGLLGAVEPEVLQWLLRFDSWEGGQKMAAVDPGEG